MDPPPPPQPHKLDAHLTPIPNPNPTPTPPPPPSALRPHAALALDEAFREDAEAAGFARGVRLVVVLVELSASEAQWSHMAKAFVPSARRAARRAARACVTRCLEAFGSGAACGLLRSREDVLDHWALRVAPPTVAGALCNVIRRSGDAGWREEMLRAVAAAAPRGMRDGAARERRSEGAAGGDVLLTAEEVRRVVEERLGSILGEQRAAAARAAARKRARRR